MDCLKGRNAELSEGMNELARNVLDLLQQVAGTFDASALPDKGVPLAPSSQPRAGSMTLLPSILLNILCCLIFNVFSLRQQPGCARELETVCKTRQKLSRLLHQFFLFFSVHFLLSPCR